MNGSAFNGNRRMSFRPRSTMDDRNFTQLIRLTDFCRLNHVSKWMAYRAIEKKLVIALKYRGQWWLDRDYNCLEELQEYLGVDELIFAYIDK
jgi:hypothetical protein